MQSKSCGVLSCGREHMSAIPCTVEHFPNQQARPAEYRGRSLNGSVFLCCSECRQKFERLGCVQFEVLEG